MKLRPSRTTCVPVGPRGGEKSVTNGPLKTVKLEVVVKEPLELVTAMGPVVAVEGTATWICESELAVTLPATPLNLTLAVAVPWSPTPEMLTTVLPGFPKEGSKAVTTRPEAVVKLLVVVKVEPLAVTAMGPVLAPLGTTA